MVGAPRQDRDNLATKVSDRIQEIRVVEPYQIQVKQQGAVIMLEGTVGAEVDKKRIAKAAREAPVVRTVEDQLSLKTPVPDEELRAKLLETFSDSDFSSVEGFEVTASEGRGGF